MQNGKASINRYNCKRKSSVNYRASMLRVRGNQYLIHCNPNPHSFQKPQLNLQENPQKNKIKKSLISCRGGKKASKIFQK